MAETPNEEAEGRDSKNTATDRSSHRSFRLSRPLIDLPSLLGALFIIAFLAAIVIPNLMPRGIRNNESAGIGNLRTITGAQTGYKEAHGVYARSFAELTDMSNGAAFLLGRWEGTPKTGYLFTLKPTDNGDCYETTASPATPNSGERHFFSDCSGVIRAREDAPADSRSPPIGE